VPEGATSPLVGKKKRKKRKTLERKLKGAGRTVSGCGEKHSGPARLLIVRKSDLKKTFLRLVCKGGKREVTGEEKTPTFERIPKGSTNTPAKTKRI